MIELAFSACLLGNPAHCRDVSLIFADLSPIQCQMGIGSQIQMQKWKAAHPNWVIGKWRCQVPGQFAKI